MIYLINGENLYESWGRYNSFLSEVKKSGDFQINLIDGEVVKNVQEVFAESSMNSFFQTKKVLFIKRIFKNRSKKIKEEIAGIINKEIDYDIVFWEEGNADKRTKLYKTIKKIGQIEDFKSKKPHELKVWIKKVLNKTDIALSDKSIELIIDRSGSNQMIISNILKKIELYSESTKKKDISIDLIKTLSSSAKEESIWELVDNVSKSNFKKSLLIMESIINSDSDYPYVFSMLTRQIRMLYLVNKYQSMSLRELSSFLGIHSFALGKIYPLAKNFTSSRLMNAYDRLVNLDYKVKQGIIDPKLGLNLFVLSFR